MAPTGEGVETQEELDYLRKEGCTEVQRGYYFSRPRPASEVCKILDTRAVNAKVVHIDDVGASRTRLLDAGAPAHPCSPHPQAHNSLPVMRQRYAGVRAL